MNYDKIYDQLILRSKNRILATYTEKHHIEPRCVGGSDDITNIAILTASEHYLAHLLLVKMDRYKRHVNHSKLIFAARMMTRSSNHCRSNKEYAWLKAKASRAMSEFQSTRPRSREHGEAIGRAQLGNTRALGTKRSSESKQLISRALSGRIRSDEHRENLSKALRGKPRSKRGPTGKPAWNRGIPAPVENSKKAWETRRARMAEDPTYGKVKIPQSPEHARRLIESRARNKELKNG